MDQQTKDYHLAQSAVSAAVVVVVVVAAAADVVLPFVAVEVAVFESVVVVAALVVLVIVVVRLSKTVEVVFLRKIITIKTLLLRDNSIHSITSFPSNVHSARCNRKYQSLV